MSIAEPTLPAEAQANAHAPADLGGGMQPVPPTPGVSSGPARIPTLPTLPEADPAALTLAVTQLVNHLWNPPPLGPAHPAPTVGGAMDLHSLSAAAPATQSAAPSLPSGSDGNPFFAVPQFDALFSDGSSEPTLTLESFQLPLLPGPALAGPEPAVAEPALPSVTTPPAAVHAYELQPAMDPALFRAGSGSGPEPGPGPGFDAYALKREFPILEERVHGRPLVWLDNAATTQKPRAVIDRIRYFYEHENSNVHRAAHTLAARATEAYEKARESVRRFLHAPSGNDIVFVRGATEGINLVAQAWGRRFIGAGDEIVITHLEHHANIVPWQMLCEEKGARLRVAPVDDHGQLLLDEYEKLFNSRTRLAAVTMVSNALGTVTPAAAMVEIAHRYGAYVLLDGAQAVSHLPVDVQALDCDFFVFSGHKVFAPTGIGALYGRQAILNHTPPWQGGGNMIEDVTFERTRYQPAPARFEAGTGNLADAVGLGAALDWLSRVGIANVGRHEHDLLSYATRRLLAIPGLRIIGTAAEKAGVISFTLAGKGTQDVAAALDHEGIAVRGGHHCAQPTLRRFGLESTVRASFAPYNVQEDVDALVDALCEMLAQGA